MVALRSHATTLVLLALCSCFAFLHVHSELMDPQIICESCLLAAREIEKTLQAVAPRKRRPVLIELMVDNEVCNRLAPSEGFLTDDLAAACVQLFDSYSEDFYLTLMSRPPKLLESIFCYQKSSACESVEEEDEDEEGESNNMEDVPIAQHSQTATKDEL